MSDNSCDYNCSQHPETVFPYPDISGIGVVIGYVGTAGIAVCIIVFCYFTAHDPKQDPFQKYNAPSAVDYQPNVVDVAILNVPSRLRRNWTSTSIAPQRVSNRHLQNSCINCVRAMSDLQLLTGFSILISGFCQLQCGLSAYHWQILVYLAWFSSLTNLSCLTFLRNHLYSRPGARAWRLFAMGILLIMLIAAMVPTGNYNWPAHSNTQTRPAPSDFATCYRSLSKDTDHLTMASMLLSVVLLALGFLLRLVKLHKSISVDIVGYSRAKISRFIRKCLIKVYNKSNLENSPRLLYRLYIYRPLLASFLVLKYCFTVWTSMAFEIWWLLASFIWGLIRLITALRISDNGNSQWTFGQVAPVVILAAPVIATIEYVSSENPTRTTEQPQSDADPDSQSVQTDSSDLSESAGLLRDHPERRWYEKSDWIQDFISFVISDMIVSTIFVFTLYSTNNNRIIEILIPEATFWNWFLIFQPLLLILFVLFFLLLEDITQLIEHPHFSVRMAKFGIFYILLGFPVLSLFSIGVVSGLAGGYILYVIAGVYVAHFAYIDEVRR